MDRIFKRPFLWPGAAGRTTLLSTPIGPLGPAATTTISARRRRSYSSLVQSASCSCPFLFLDTLVVVDRRPWRCPDLGHPFTRFLAATGCPATRRTTRFQRRYYEGREALTHTDPGQELRPHSPKIPIRWIDRTASL